MDFDSFFKERLDALHSEGPLPRLRRSGAALRPLPARLRPPHRRRSHRVVLERLSRHGPASGGAGGDGSRDARHRRRRRRHAQHLRHQPRACAARARACRSARARGGAGLHLGLCRQRGGAVDAGRQHARHGRAVGCDEPRLDDRRHPQQPRRARHLPPQRPRASGRAARRAAGRAAEARLLRVGLFDGWRHRADRRRSATSPSATAR